MIDRTEQLSAYLDGELEPEEHIQIERLLAEDACLREQLEGLQRASASLRLLERHAPPPGLDLVPLRILGRMDQHQDLLDRCQSYLPMPPRRPSGAFLPAFALMMVIGLALYNYTTVASLDEPPEDTAVIDGRAFVREGSVWYQRGAFSLFLWKPRPVDLASSEGRQLLAKRPELERFTELGEVVLDGENDGVLRLIPGSSIGS